MQRGGWGGYCGIAGLRAARTGGGGRGAGPAGGGVRGGGGGGGGGRRGGGGGGEGGAFISRLRSGARPVAVSTARGYETALRLFCEYVTDPRYEWAELCETRFGRRPVQVFHEWNSVAHVTDYE